jgi:hypothetical protein
MPKGYTVEEWRERFWARVYPPGPGGCREWSGNRFSGGCNRTTLVGTEIDGYGIVAMRHGGKRVHGSHRVAWTLTHGAIPDRMFVLHRCDNRACCEPSHLFLGTAMDNARDRDLKGRSGTKGMTHKPETIERMREGQRRRWAKSSPEQRAAAGARLTAARAAKEAANG